MKYYLIDDALCDLDSSLDCYEDCTQCPLFEECMEIEESEENKNESNFILSHHSCQGN